MSDPSSANVITIDGRAIEYRLERRGDTTALILHGGHMSVQCRFGEETFLKAGYSVLATPVLDMAERPSARDRQRRSSPSAWQDCVACWVSAA